jgi:hypothetical protein
MNIHDSNTSQNSLTDASKKFCTLYNHRRATFKSINVEAAAAGSPHIIVVK